MYLFVIHISFMKYLFKSFLKLDLFFFSISPLLLNCVSPLHIMNTSPLTDLCVLILYSQSVDCLNGGFE